MISGRPAVQGHDLAQKDVLLVDNEKGVRDVLGAILEDNGYIVDLAATVADAKMLIRNHRYGMVLADWRLPDGDGSLIANLAAEAGSYAFVMSGYLGHMLPGSVDTRLTLMKPVQRAELLATVRACIGAATHSA